MDYQDLVVVFVFRFAVWGGEGGVASQKVVVVVVVVIRCCCRCRVADVVVVVFVVVNVAFVVNTPHLREGD